MYALAYIIYALCIVCIIYALLSAFCDFRTEERHLELETFLLSPSVLDIVKTVGGFFSTIASTIFVTFGKNRLFHLYYTGGQGEYEIT